MLRKNVDEEKKLKLNQPILSVRRISSPPSSKDDDDKGKETDPVRSPGVVPFMWEDSPGKPKSSPEDRTVNVTHQGFDKAVRRRLSFTNIEEQQEANFVFFKGSHRTDRTNPHTNKDFMIGLFLPANKRIGSEMPVFAPRTQGTYQGPRRMRHYHQSHDFEGEDNDEVQANNFPPKVFRGVPRFCVRSSIFIVNPVPAMNFRRGQRYSFARSCTRVNNERPKGDVTKQISDVLNTSQRFAASVGHDAMRTCKKLGKKLQHFMAADRSDSMQGMEKSSIPETDSPRMMMNEQDEEEEEEEHQFAADFTSTDDDDDDDEDEDGGEREEQFRNRENAEFDLQTSSYRFDEDEERCIKEEMRSRNSRHSADLSFEFPVSPPPLPESPSESWLSRTLPSLPAKSAPSTPRRLPLRYPTAKPSEVKKEILLHKEW